jgi:hypothetical protein
MRSLLAVLLLALATSIAAAQTGQTNPPPTDSGDGRGCGHERDEPTTS